MQKKITTTITNLTNSHLSREEKKKLFVKLLQTKTTITNFTKSRLSREEKKENNLEKWYIEKFSTITIIKLLNNITKEWQDL